MIALITTLIILLTIPLAAYEGFLPNTTQFDTITTITSEEEVPCITPADEESLPPASDDDSSPPSSNNNNNDNDTSRDTNESGGGNNSEREDSNDKGDDSNGNEDTDTDDPGANNDTRSPRPTKFKAKTPKNLAKKIQKKVKQGLNSNKGIPTPTPKRSLFQFPQFPEDFPFNNKKTPTTIKSGPTPSPEQEITIANPDIKIPNKDLKKTNKKLNVPDAKEIQKNVKQKLKSNSKSRVQADPCEPVSEDTGERTLYFKVKVQANVGTTSKLVVGATVRILQDGELITTLTTNEDGWATTRLPLGTYMVEVLDPDYKPAYKEVSIAQNEQVTQGGIQIVLEPQPQQSSNQNPDTKTFTVVISVDGNNSDLPLKGTVLTIIQDGNSLTSCTIESTSCGFSLLRGDYVVTTSSPNYQPTSASFTVVGKSAKNPENYIETVFIPMEPYNAKNPAPKQAVGPSSINADVVQYNSILECFGQDKSAKKCSSKQKKQADLNKDGKVDQKDYNIFLYEIRIR